MSGRARAAVGIFVSGAAARPPRGCARSVTRTPGLCACRPPARWRERRAGTPDGGPPRPSSARSLLAGGRAALPRRPLARAPQGALAAGQGGAGRAAGAVRTWCGPSCPPARSHGLTAGRGRRPEPGQGGEGAARGVPGRRRGARMRRTRTCSQDCLCARPARGGRAARPPATGSGAARGGPRTPPCLHSAAAPRCAAVLSRHWPALPPPPGSSRRGGPSAPAPPRCREDPATPGPGRAPLSALRGQAAAAWRPEIGQPSWGVGERSEPEGGRELVGAPRQPAAAAARAGGVPSGTEERGPGGQPCGHSAPARQSARTEGRAGRGARGRAGRARAGGGRGRRPPRCQSAAHACGAGLTRPIY